MEQIIVAISLFAGGACFGGAWVLSHPEQVEKWERKDREFVDESD